VSADSQKSYWLRSGLFSFFEKGSAFLFGFGATVILMRYFSKADFGVWVWFLALTSILEVSLVGLNMNAVVKFSSTAKDKNEYRSIQTASLSLNITLTILAAIVLFGISMLLEANPLFLGKNLDMTHLPYMLRVYCATIIMLIPFYHFNYMSQANLDFKGVFWSGFVRKGLFFLVVLSFLFLNDPQSITLLPVIQLGAAILASVIAFSFGKKYFAFGGKLDMKWVHTIFHYSKYTFGTNLSTMLYKTIDKFMLGGMISEVAIAIYQAAISITNLVEVPATSVANVVFPQGARNSEKTGEERKKSLCDLYEKSVGAILAILVPFIAVVFIVPELPLWIIAGQKYLDAAPILRITILYGLFLPFAIQFGTVLDSMGKPKVNFYFTMASAVLNIFFNYIFIKNFGTIGAAYGTLCTYFVAFICFQFMLNNILGVKMYRPFQYIPGFYRQAFDIAKGFIGKKDVSAKTGV